MSFRLKTALTACLLLLAAVCAMQLLAGNAGDKEWLLLAAREWLGGKTLYVDIVEVNPPLIVWLYAVPVWLAAHAPALEDYQFLALLGLMGCALSIAAATRLIALHPAFAHRRAQAQFALLLAFLFVVFTRPAYFFDRDHIFLVLAFPYMLRFMPTLAHAPVPLRLRLLIGGMAALGFCIKPYTVIIFAALQALMLCRERSAALLLSLENRIVAAAGAVYLACIWWYAPDYIRVVFPMALATYAAFSRRAFGIFYGILAFVTAGVGFADFRPGLASPYRRDVFYFIGVSVAFLAYALVGNGWGYGWHPLITLLLFLCGWLIWEYGWLVRTHAARGLPVKRFLFGRRACAINLIGNAAYSLYCVVAFFVAQPCERSSDCVKNQPYLRYIAEHHVRSFGAFSEDFHKWPSLARLSGARFETRYNALWMLPQIVHEKTPSPLQVRIVAEVGRGLADDLRERRPDIVFVDASPEFFGYPFRLDLPAFFSAVPEFKAAWRHYRRTSVIDSCTTGGGDAFPVLAGCRYDIYERAP